MPGVGGFNSCGSMHGVDMHDNSLVVHENSWSALGHKNSRSSHAVRVQGGTKAPSMSTRFGVRRSAVEKLASAQKLHVEVPRAEILSGGGNRLGVCCFGRSSSCLDHSPEPPGTGRVIRNMLGWSQLEKTERCGVWVFWGALRRENLFSSLCAAGDWERKGSYRTAWSVPCDSLCTCSYSYGRGPL